MKEVKVDIRKSDITPEVGAELFSEFAHNLEKNLPEREVFVVTHANGSTQYIPSNFDFENKFYASTFASHIWG